jgi:uncharacterized protein
VNQVLAADSMSSAPGRESVRQLSVLQLLALGLAPGALGVAVYIAVEQVTGGGGYPPVAALLVAIVVAIIPFEISALLVAQRRAHARKESLIPYRSPLAWRTYAWLVPVLLLAAVAASVILTPADAGLQTYMFGRLPAWFKAPIDPSNPTLYSRQAWVVTLTAYMILNSVVGPVVEEFYFRGFLLPRMERFGRWAPLLNACLFSLYHFWLPWAFLSRVGAVAPYIYAVRWRRNIYVGMAVHILLNTIGGGLVVAQIASRT